VTSVVFGSPSAWRWPVEFLRFIIFGEASYGEKESFTPSLFQLFRFPESHSHREKANSNKECGSRRFRRLRLHHTQSIKMDVKSVRKSLNTSLIFIIEIFGFWKKKNYM